MTRTSLEAKQARILATARELRALGVPKAALAPIIRWACVDMWSEASARVHGSSLVRERFGA